MLIKINNCQLFVKYRIEKFTFNMFLNLKKEGAQ